jgi:hypothetical protein
MTQSCCSPIEHHLDRQQYAACPILFPRQTGVVAMKGQRIVLLLLVMLIGMLNIGAQEILVYRQTFDTNKMYWPIDENFSIVDGEYVLHTENQELYAYLDLSSKDGTFQLDTRLITGKSTAGYGLLFRLQDPYNFYFFFLVDQGYFLAGKAVDRQGINFCPWTYTSIIKAQAKIR